MKDYDDQFDHIALPVSQIVILNKNDICSNVRTDFDVAKATALREDIRTKGLINPPVVRKHKGVYSLIGGERRFRSVQKLIADNAQCWSISRKEFVPAKELYAKLTVRCIECDDLTAIGLAISDNVIRENLSEIEKINACIKLDIATNEEGDKLMTRARIAEIFGVSESWVSLTISIGNLPKCALNALNDGIINRTSALQLLKTEPSKIPQVIERAVQIVTEETAAKIQEAISEIEQLTSEVNTATTDANVAEMKHRTAPLHKKAEAGKAKRHANEALDAAAIALKNSTDRMKALNKTGNPRNLPADVISQANEECGARTGKGRPLSTKQIRETKEEIIETMKTAKTSKLKRELAIMLMTVRLLLREINASDIMDALRSVE